MKEEVRFEKYRMYIDEVGNSHMGSSGNPNQRYLSLTGVILELQYAGTTAYEAVERLKRRYFESHPDDPVTLHRKDLVNFQNPFHSLRNEATRERFNTELLMLLRELEYTVISVVIDKQEHNERYSIWKFDPYHYCLQVIVERFVQFLTERQALGDVMIESRGGKEDLRLKASFERVFETGTDYLSAQEFLERLTSKQLKVKAKQNNVTGLQLADLLAHPAWRTALARRLKERLPDNFGRRVAEILIATKFRRSPNGRIDGWGIKWLP